MAVRWLARLDLAAADALVDLLGYIDGKANGEIGPAFCDGAWQNSEELCSLHCGALISDLASQFERGERLTFYNVRQPLILLPFAAWAAEVIERPVQIELDGYRIATDGRSISEPPSPLLASADKVVISHSEIACSNAPMNTRCDISGAAYERLSAFAHRTYAPATEESRLLRYKVWGWGWVRTEEIRSKIWICTWQKLNLEAFRSAVLIATQ